MAYSAGLGLTDAHLDTTRPGGVIAHPVFPVAVEWEVLTGPMMRIDIGLGRDERLRGVHAGHDLILHRPLRQGDEVAVTATLVGVEATSPGARVTVRLDAVDVAHGNQPLWTTWYVMVYRGVSVIGPGVPPVGWPDRPVRPAPPTTPPASIDRRTITIPATAAHVYTECARIWNPIHTDLAVARAAGLPGTILHGTATLAHGITSTVDMIGASPDAVRRLGGSFRAMVPMPTMLTVDLLAAEAVGETTVVHFQIRTVDGAVAVRDGFVEITVDTTPATRQRGA